MDAQLDRAPHEWEQSLSRRSPARETVKGKSPISIPGFVRQNKSGFQHARGNMKRTTRPTLILAGDIGGTNTRLGLFRCQRLSAVF